MEETIVSAGPSKPGLAAPTVAQAFARTVEAVPQRVALRTRGGESEWTWAEYNDRVERFATSLAKLGLERSQTLAIMLNNRPEFHFADSAALALGVTPFSLYQTLAADQVAYQLRDSGARAVVTEPAFIDRVLGAVAEVPAVEHVILMDETRDGALAFDELVQAEADSKMIEAARAQVSPDDLLTLIYTSGTTGPPKGVQITQHNIMSAVKAYDEVVDFPEGARVVSYLPMAHIAERATGHYLPIVLGHTVTSCPNPREVIAYMPEVRPTWFFGVPRIFEKLKAGLEAMVSFEQDEQRKAALQNAIDLGTKRVRLEQAGEFVPADLASAYEQADRDVLQGLRVQLGLDAAENIYVGAAPTPMPVLEFFHAIGVPVAELWGLSESTGCGTVNLPGKIKLGTVGQVTPGMELELAADGEILLRGPEIMTGYRNLPEKTAEAIDPQGWLHTGDIGELDQDGYLKIVDRKKELIITAGGKNISPSNLEAKLKAHPLIGTACVIGDDKPFISALIVLDPDTAPAWAAEHGLDGSSLEDLAKAEDLQAEIARAVDQLNAGVSNVEGIKKFIVLATDWVPGGDELTPTMKLKRKPITEKYASQIEAMYAK